MADSTSAPSDAAVPPNTMPAQPRDGARPARSGMSEYAAKLAGQQIICDQDNEPDWPVTSVQLDVVLLRELFARLLFQLILACSREMGYPNLAAANALQDLRLMATSVAWNALSAAYTVLYNKGIKLLPSTFMAMTIPPLNYLNFPIYITALINSIGPIIQDGFPARRQYVPYFSYAALTAALPQGYSDEMVARFFEKFPKTKYLTANVEPLGTTSHAWWAIWPVPGTASTIGDRFSSAQNPGTLRSVTLFSPVPYSEILNELKMALCYLSSPLVTPGMAHFSASPWYETDALVNLAGAQPTLRNFPLEARTYPYYDKSHKAVIHKIERATFDVEMVDAPTTAVATTSTDNASSRGTKRRLTMRTGSPSFVPVSPGQPTPAEPQTTHQYRIVYYYFQHVATTEITPNSYLSFPHNFNAIA